METSSFSVERRVRERLRVSLPVETEGGPAVTRDVSVSGLYLVTDQQLATGEQLQLAVTLPYKGCSPQFRLDLRGRVARVEEGEEMNTPVRARPTARGFSMVELLVAIFMAGIIFAAMVPVFAGALKKSASDNNRVTATSLAQERIERVRALPFKDITASNLNSATWPPGVSPPWFDTSTNVGGKPYTFHTDVVDGLAPAGSPAGSPVPYKSVTVAVTWWETWTDSTGESVSRPYTTTVKTDVKNPDAIMITTAPTPTAAPTAFAVTVSFKYPDDVYYSSSTTHGVSILNITDGTTWQPANKCTDATHPTVSWTGVPKFMPDGITVITYQVQCRGAHLTSKTPPFHLLSDAWLDFDTNPGG